MIRITVVETNTAEEAQNVLTAVFGEVINDEKRLLIQKQLEVADLEQQVLTHTLKAQTQKPMEITGSTTGPIGFRS